MSPLAQLRSLGGQTIRYTLVGGCCALLNNVLIILGDHVGIGYAAMCVIAGLVVAPTGYLLHCRFTFAERPSPDSFLRFAAVAAAGFPLFLGCMACLCSGLRVPVGIATPVATVMLYGWNFASAHWVLVRRAG